MNEINVGLFQNLLLKVKNYRDLSETNFYQIKRDITGAKCYIYPGQNIHHFLIVIIVIIDKLSLAEITKVINDASLEIERLYNDYEVKERDHLKYKTDLSRLYVEVQKQSLLTLKYILLLNIKLLRFNMRD